MSGISARAASKYAWWRGGRTVASVTFRESSTVSKALILRRGGEEETETQKQLAFRRGRDW